MTSISITDLNNAKVDIDHIASIANSTALTATDRLGRTKKTIKGVLSSLTAVVNRGAWVSSTSYQIKDIVSNSGIWYIAVTDHTSGSSFSTDVSLYWKVYQGALLSDLADDTGSTLIGHKANGTGAGANTVRDKLLEKISPADGGAIGDGVTNDSAAFTYLETNYPGQSIDLLGKQYSVTTIPAGCRYFNGTFIAGTTRLSLRKNQLDNPMDGNSWIAIGDGLTHYWLFGFVYLEDTGKMIAFVKPAYRHGTSNSSPLNAIFSDDRGVTWRAERTIHTVSGFDISHAACAVMDTPPGGTTKRIGLVAYVKDITTAVYRNDFIFSDNAGLTWTVVTDIVPGQSMFNYGDLISYPTIAGGSDSTGFIAYGYASSGGRTLRTINNGNSWTSQNSSNINTNFTETSVVRVNNEAKWLMFLRDEGANMFVSTSTNMTSWTVPVDTGFNLTSNPVYAVVERGRLFVYCFLRDFYPTTAGKENQIICFEESPTDVYTASNLVLKAPRLIADGLDRNVGYPCIRKVDDDFVWGYTTAESAGSTNTASSSLIVFGSTRKVPSVGVGYVNGLSAGKNILRNPTFHFWSRGTSFPNMTAATRIADGWSYLPGGSTTTISRVDISAEKSMLFPFNPQYGLSINSVIPEDYTGIYQLFKGIDELRRFSEQQITFQIWGIGDLPASSSPFLPRINIWFDYGTGGSTLATTSASLYVTEQMGNVWKASVTLTAPTIIGKTIGTSTSVKIILDSQSTLPWNAIICGIKAEFSTFASKFEPIDLEQARKDLNRYVQVVQLTASDALCGAYATSPTSASGVLTFDQMTTSPIITRITGLASDIEVVGGGATSAVTFSSVSSRSALVNLTTTGLTTGTGSYVRCKAAPSTSVVTLLLDAE